MRLTRSINPLSVLLQRAILRRLSPLLVTLLLASMLVQDALADEQTSAAVSAASATSVTSTSAATSTDAEAAAKQDKKTVRRAGLLGGVAGKALLGTPAGRVAGLVLGRTSAKQLLGGTSAATATTASDSAVSKI